jgi:hypothetical protein
MASSYKPKKPALIMAEIALFPQSRELKGIIESHGWTAVDVTRPEGVRAEWHEINQTPLTGQFEFGRMYLLVTQPKAGQTVEQAYKTTKGLPALLVENHEDTRFDYVEIDKGLYEAKKPIPFTRLLFYDVKGKQGVAAVSIGAELDARLSIGLQGSPDNRGLARLDAWLQTPQFIAVKAQYAVEMFRMCFRIAPPEEYFVFLPEIV